MTMSCANDKSIYVPNPDKSAPSTVLTQPYDNEEDVDIDDSVMVVFSETLNCASVDSVSFRLDPHVSSLLSCLGDTLLLLPLRPLGFGARYTATLSGSITDLSGNPFGKAYSWSFTTRNALPTETWRVVSVPLLSSGGLTDVAFSGQRYVAVGGLGAVAFSDDGLTWHEIVQPTPRNVFGVTWADTVFVAVGEGDLILTSIDGTDWVQRLTGHAARVLRDVTASDHRIVAVGGHLASGNKYLGDVRISSDGIEWEPVEVEIDCELTSVAWTGHSFVAAGFRKDGTVTVWLSESGATWTLSHEQENFYFNRPCIASCGDTVVIVAGKEGAGILFSPEMRTWSIALQPQSNGLYAVAWTGSRFVAIGSGGVALSSLNGFDWSSHETKIPHSFWGVTGSRRQIVAVGGSRAMVSP
jgi:photosystem II stability/assembly factor-like uncharacterized protein